MTYYVYAYLRAKESPTAKAGTPYYIGKGSKNRAYSHHGRVPVPKNSANIVFLENNLTEIGAFALERRMIAWYGRKDLGKGILLNRTDGGEGNSGGIWSREARLALSLALSLALKDVDRKGEKNGMFGKKHSEAVKIASSIRRAQTNSMRRWYHNGIEDKLCFNPPGPDWKKGRLKTSGSKGFRWYNNGKVNISSLEKPDGDEWQEGMLRKKWTTIENKTHNFFDPGHRKMLAERQQELLRNGQHSTQVAWTCEKCGKSGKGISNYARWHGVKCRG